MALLPPGKMEMGVPLIVTAEPPGVSVWPFERTMPLPDGRIWTGSLPRVASIVLDACRGRAMLLLPITTLLPPAKTDTGVPDIVTPAAPALTVCPF